MKPTAYFVNTARGPIVTSRRCTRRWPAARSPAPPSTCSSRSPRLPDNPLLQLDNIIVTPHHVCVTDECINTVTASVFNACRELAHGRVPRNVVNQQVLGRVPYFHA